MIVIPAIDLRQGQCVRLVQGRKDAVKVYDADPAKVARAFTAAGAGMLHIVDLDAAFGEPNLANRDKLKKILETVRIPVQLGGGLRSFDDVFRVLDLGVQRVVLGSVAIEAPDTLIEMISRFGPDKIVVGIDAKDGCLRTHGWEVTTEIDALSFAHRVAALGVKRVVYTDIRRDGMLSGPNLEQTKLIASETGLRVTASGGVSAIEDLLNLKTLDETRVDSVIVGKALYEGRFTLPEAMAAVS